MKKLGQVCCLEHVDVPALERRDISKIEHAIRCESDDPTESVEGGPRLPPYEILHHALTCSYGYLL